MYVTAPGNISWYTDLALVSPLLRICLIWKDFSIPFWQMVCQPKRTTASRNRQGRWWRLARAFRQKFHDFLSVQKRKTPSEWWVIRYQKCRGLRLGRVKAAKEEEGTACVIRGPNIQTLISYRNSIVTNTWSKLEPRALFVVWHYLKYWCLSALVRCSSDVKWYLVLGGSRSPLLFVFTLHTISWYAPSPSVYSVGVHLHPTFRGGTFKSK